MTRPCGGLAPDHSADKRQAYPHQRHIGTGRPGRSDRAFAIGVGKLRRISKGFDSPPALLAVAAITDRAEDRSADSLTTYGPANARSDPDDCVHLSHSPKM